MVAGQLEGDNVVQLFRGPFRALSNPAFRLWFIGTTISSFGTWLQRTAQDWLVLTQLTHRDGAALGLVVALQFGPQLVLLPWIGMVADRYDRRRLLMATQAMMGLLSLALGALTISGWVALWHVYLFSLLFGCVSAFDTPARHSFAIDLVDEHHLHNAVSLNSISFNLSRLAGPALAGLAIAAVGTGWAFIVNGLSFLAVLASAWRLRAPAGKEVVHEEGDGLLTGLRYIAAQPDLRAMLGMLLLIGMFGLNSAIFISTMAVGIFHADAATFGLLSSIMATGTIAGALVMGSRDKPRADSLNKGALVFAAACVAAALAPDLRLFGCALVAMGVASFAILNSSNSLMQLATDPAMRGRVMAVRLAVTLGGTAIGAPLVGAVANVAGPRAALGLAALSGLGAAAIGIRHGRRAHSLSR